MACKCSKILEILKETDKLKILKGIPKQVRNYYLVGYYRKQLNRIRRVLEDKDDNHG